MSEKQARLQKSDHVDVYVGIIIEGRETVNYAESVDADVRANIYNIEFTIDRSSKSWGMKKGLFER